MPPTSAPTSAIASVMPTTSTPKGVAHSFPFCAAPQGRQAAACNRTLPQGFYHRGVSSAPWQVPRPHKHTFNVSRAQAAPA
eukprot:366239-Chlamydomonas_euryale.AAC.28